MKIFILIADWTGADLFWASKSSKRKVVQGNRNSNNQIPSSDGDSDQANENQPSDGSIEQSDEMETDRPENAAIQCVINGNYYEFDTILSLVCPIGYQSAGNIKGCCTLKPPSI